MTAAYELRNVSRTFQLGDREFNILRGINLHVNTGEYVALMGPSGSGKSTLMHILGCLDMPTSGDMSIMGHDILRFSDDQISDLRCRFLGFVFQAFHLLPAYDAVSNVSLAMAYSGVADREERSEELLRKLGLGHRLGHHPRTLSGGEKQRVAIARALANNPPILLADEPTGALDQSNGRALMDLFDELHRQGKTIILVTHDPNIAKRARRVVEIVDGEIRRDTPLKPKL